MRVLFEIFILVLKIDYFSEFTKKHFFINNVNKERLTNEVEPCLATQAHGEKANHLVESQAAVDDRRHWRHRRHEVVHL